MEIHSSFLKSNTNLILHVLQENSSTNQSNRKISKNINVVY